MTTYKLYPNVQIGEGAQIGDFVLIGVPPQGAEPGDLKTIVVDQHDFLNESSLFLVFLVYDLFLL